MSGNQDELAEIYRGLSDEYLVAELASGELTEAAQAVARQELHLRGIDPPVAPLPVDEGVVPEVDQESVEFVTVARFLVPTEAYILRGRLEAEGIPAVVTDANLVQANNLISVAVGGARVQVPAAFVPEAQAIVSAVRRGEFSLREEDG